MPTSGVAVDTSATSRLPASKAKEMNMQRDHPWINHPTHLFHLEEPRDCRNDTRYPSWTQSSRVVEQRLEVDGDGLPDRSQDLR